MKVSVAVTLFAALALAPVHADVFLWPQPQSVVWGNGTLPISGSFKIVVPNVAELTAAASRYTSLIKSESWIPVQAPFTGPPANAASVKLVSRSTPTLKLLAVSVSDTKTDLIPGVDESYTLSISSKGGNGTLTSKTIWGALRGLETFSQLVQSQGSGLVVAKSPVTITDKPVFPHRGLMLDTSRNYYPVADILRTIDAIAYNKMNVFHWHITDSHSFPLELKTVPDLANKGAYYLQGNKLSYSATDVQNIVQYARARGVRVIPEIDMPAHTGSWAKAYPEITTCSERFYLDPTNDWGNRYASEPGSGQLNPILAETYTIVSKVIKEVASLFPDTYYHAGGDEPVFKCWNDSSSVVAYEKAHHATGADLLNMFLQNSTSYARSAGKTAIIWEDAVTTSNLPIPSSTILQVWTNPAKQAISKGYSVILSNYNFWYLDCGHGGWSGNDTSYDEQAPPPYPPEIQTVMNANPTVADDISSNWATQNWGGNGGDWCAPFKSWQRVYSYDLWDGLSTSQRKKVLGGEVALWSEQSDTTTLDTKLWPRSAAAAEVLWSGRYDAQGKQRDIGDAMPRIFDWRYRLLARGIRAEPLQPLWCGQNPHFCDISYPAAFSK